MKNGNCVYGDGHLRNVHFHNIIRYSFLRLISFRHGIVFEMCIGLNFFMQKMVNGF